MLKSVKITRSDEPDAVFVISHSPTSPLPETFFYRFVNYRLLVDTHIPEQYQILSGALVTTLLNDPKITKLEIWQTNAGFWFADAYIQDGEQKVFRRGEGSTPDEALNYLILNIQRF
jgi:hypothetical protein